MPGERRARVRAGRDPYARLVCHPHTLAVTFGDRARALDDDRIERSRVVEKRLHHEKRGNDSDIALFDDTHGSLVKEGRMLDRVDPRLGSHAHPARPVRVRCDAQPSVVRLGRGGRGLFWGVLRYLGRGAVAEDAARREELDHLCAGRDLFTHGLAHLVRTIRDAADFETVAPSRRDPAAARDDARTLEESLFDRAAEVDDDRGVRHRSCAIEEAIDLEDCPHAPGSIVRRCPTRSSSVFARAASYHRTTTVAGSSTSPPRSSRFWACVTRPTLRRYARSSRRCARGSGR